MDLSFSRQFSEVLNGNDVDALKTALQNLMVLFETQNRNYMELKQQVKSLKLRKPTLGIEKMDTFTIDTDDTKPMTDGLVEGAYELLASMRLARKNQDKTMADVKGSLKSVIAQENTRRSRLASALANRE